MSMVISGDNGLTFPAGSTQVQAGNYQTMVNRIINGRMEIDQRNAGASVTPVDGQYTVDRWGAFLSQSSKYTVQQNAGSVTPPAGFNNYLGLTVGASANVTVGAADYFAIVQYIEGFNVADFDFGTANAKTVTLSFWVRSSVTGTFGGCIRNSAASRNYPFSYSISSANTWEQKTITIAGDTTGTWLKTNGIGLAVWLSIGTGSTYSDTAGAWTTKGSVVSATGATNLISTNGATFYITGVDLRVGSYTVVPQDFRAYGTELDLCQRYFRRITSGNSNTGGILGVGAQTGTAGGYVYVSISPPMRTTPTIAFNSLIVSDSTSFDTAASVGSITGTQDSIYLDVTYSASGATYRPINLRATSNSSGRLDMSSEL